MSYLEVRISTSVFLGINFSKVRKDCAGGIARKSMIISIIWRWMLRSNLLLLVLKIFLLNSINYAILENLQCWICTNAQTLTLRHKHSERETETERDAA